MAAVDKRAVQDHAIQLSSFDHEIAMACEDPNQLRSLWRELDVNGDGVVSLRELLQFIKARWPLLANKTALRDALRRATMSEDGEGLNVERGEFRSLLKHVVYSSDFSPGAAAPETPTADDANEADDADDADDIDEAFRPTRARGLFSLTHIDGMNIRADAALEEEATQRLRDRAKQKKEARAELEAERRANAAADAAWEARSKQRVMRKARRKELEDEMRRLAEEGRRLAARQRINRSAMPTMGCTRAKESSTASDAR